MAVSVVIPVGPYENERAPLLNRLHLIPQDWQIVIALCEECESMRSSLSARAELVVTPAGRALQMNAGAQRATGEFLWFLHVDSELTAEVVSVLESAISYHPDKLLYCRLGFAQDGAGPTWLNASAANLRSRWLGVPFGDQGLCLPRRCFDDIGGYREDLPYGEDHVLVWTLRLAGVPLQELSCRLISSARKYRSKGWLKLTVLYQWYWIRQAAPYALRLLSKKFIR